MARWEITFWCETCNRDINGRVHSNDSLPENAKPWLLEQLKHDHFDDNHLTCKCGKSIKRHEIADGVWDGNAMKAICRDCAESIYGAAR